MAAINDDEEDSRQSPVKPIIRPTVKVSADRKVSDDDSGDAVVGNGDVGGSSSDESLDEEQKKPVQKTKIIAKRRVQSSLKADRSTPQKGSAPALEPTVVDPYHRKVKCLPKPVVTRKRRSGGGGGFTKEMLLSEQLAQLVGKDRMRRSDVIKKMYDVIKDRNLQDSKNKAFHICDEQLLKIFGRKRVRTFGMMKYLSKHIKDPDLIT